MGRAKAGRRSRLSRLQHAPHGAGSARRATGRPRGSRALAKERRRTAPRQDRRWGAAMPELPEVEVVRRDLEKEVVGKKIKSVEVNGMRSIRRYRQRKPFTSALDGRKITAVSRRGKYLILKMDDGNALIIHLGMSGQLLRVKTSREAVAKHTHVTITFTQGGQLRFVDPRTFGEMFVTPFDGIDQDVDPLESAMSWDYFGELLAQRHMKLKAALMDQKFLAGIGNIYSDEILHAAGLRYDRMSDELRPEEVRRLYRAVVEVLSAEVGHGEALVVGLLRLRPGHGR